MIGGILKKGFVENITIQRRTSPKNSNGFVFKNCNVFRNGTTFLKRLWRSYARVLFFNTSMSNIIQSPGWDSCKFSQHEDHIMFAEYDNFGPDSNTSKRIN
ncbi:hypothetical protein AHAS_Ahas17G0088900 [Arachis hypogaea]|uniref:pectinesterase n=1 Tax=Arachis hypogaea TaxID=3818 RepID=A0A444YCW7_ARAHY|nr:hypothetical protein Ahy_B07g087763 [Arachis hypogaea]